MVSIHHEKQVCYFHVPKTAGSYIQQSLHLFYGFANYNMLARYDLDEISFNGSDFFKRGRHVINNKGIFATNPYSSKKIGIQKYFSTSSTLLNMMFQNEEKWEKQFNNLIEFIETNERTPSNSDDLYENVCADFLSLTVLTIK